MCCSCLYTEKDYPSEHLEFVRAQGIGLNTFDMEENKASSSASLPCACDPMCMAGAFHGNQ